MSKLEFDSASVFLRKLVEPSKDAVDTASSGPSVFLSTWWLSHYVKLWEQGDQYLQSTNPFCIFGQRAFKSRLGFTYKRLGLNQSLEPRLESLTLEENGFANTTSQQSLQLLPQLLTQLNNKKGWDELRFSAVNQPLADALFGWAKTSGLIAYEYSNDETFWVDFSTLAQSDNEPYLSSRSANCRQQLRKAKRQIQDQLGELAIETATSIEQANLWLNCLGRLHQQRWPSKNPLEGFSNPQFGQFFSTLIEDGLAEGKVQLVKISAGVKPIGYLYNLVKDGRVSFLMSGIDYDGTDKYKPGLLCHWLAIEMNLANGMQVYDFLNGANRYKESLSTHRAAVKTVVIARKRLGLWLENKIRQRRRLRNNRI
jgi:hypothetical protein